MLEFYTAFAYYHSPSDKGLNRKKQQFETLFIVIYLPFPV